MSNKTKPSNLDVIEELLPKYYDDADTYRDFFRHRFETDGHLDAEINARSLLNGISADLLRNGWVTPEGQVLNDEAHEVRRLQKALRGFIKECQDAQA